SRRDCRTRAVGRASSASPSASGVAGAPPSSTAGKFAPHKLIGLVSAYEKFLARETGAILIFVVGLCRGRPNQLDRRTQLLCAKQSSSNAERRLSSFLSQRRRQSGRGDRESNSNRIWRFDRKDRRL